ncbi:MAG: transcription elongation factor GreAB [Rhodothermales bacterium]|nr:transcription elongation factor GreAB [Rhodothermales bacterium]
MSRAFVKDDAADGHVVIPPRPALPSGVANYVTPRGLRLLKEELVDLEAERGRLASARNRGTPDQARDLAVMRGRIVALEERIGSARLVKPSEQPQDEARFGATVTLREADGDAERVITIVGVDESSAQDGRIGFLAPVARRLTGKRVGDQVPMPTPRGDRPFEVVRVEYRAE